MDEALRAACRSAEYRFSTSAGNLLLKVDVPDGRLARLLDGAADGAAVLTAYNPHGQQQADAINRAAHAQLQQDLKQAGYRIWPGRNEDPRGAWPVEESFLVTGINLAAARLLASRHRQLAFLWTDAASATPRLMETAARV